ncbi:MAG: DUF4440 domain-containing protein [Terriglobales bacterium]
MLRRLIVCPLLASFFVLSSCTFYADRPVKAFGDATGGEGFERAFWGDIQKQDWKDLDAHLASNFVYLTPAGRWDRAQALQQIQQLRIQEYSIGDLATEMNRDTFVVTYTITLRGTAPGEGATDQPQRRMTVWQQQKRGWVAIAHSELGWVGKK